MIPALRDTVSLLRLSEWLLIAYFTYVAILSLLLPVDGWVAVYTWGVNLIVLVGLSSLARAERATGWAAWAVLRDWLPVALVVVAYREMGWFAPAQHTYELERTWIQWDRALLYDWGLKAAIESTGPWLPSLLELSYSLVYLVGPFGVAALYLYSSRREVDRFLVVLLLGTLLSYTLHPFFPSEPPRMVFPGEDAPAVNTVFRRFNWWLLGGGGIHTSVFPSGHVSHAFAGAFGMLQALPWHGWIGRALLGLAVSIALATVYGRYHYAADVVAGLGVALGALWISMALVSCHTCIVAMIQGRISSFKATTGGRPDEEVQSHARATGKRQLGGDHAKG